MNVTIKEVQYIAMLAKLKFSEEEAEKFAGEFENILENFKSLSAMDLEIEDKKEKELKPVFRKDEVKEFECNNLFRNVKSMDETYIKVPKIIE